MEREAILESTRKEIANKIVEMVIDSTNGGSIPLETILKMMSEAKVKIHDKKQIKKQALDIISELAAAGFPITRARMRVSIQLSSPE